MTQVFASLACSLEVARSRPRHSLPLAIRGNPYTSSQSSWGPATRTLTPTTTTMKPGLAYAIQAAPTREGPWSSVRSNVRVTRLSRAVGTVTQPTQPFDRLVLN